MHNGIGSRSYKTFFSSVFLLSIILFLYVTKTQAYQQKSEKFFVIEEKKFGRIDSWSPTLYNFFFSFSGFRHSQEKILSSSKSSIRSRGFHGNFFRHKNFFFDIFEKYYCFQFLNMISLHFAIIWKLVLKIYSESHLKIAT